MGFHSFLALVAAMEDLVGLLEVEEVVVVLVSKQEEVLVLEDLVVLEVLPTV